MRVGQLFPFVNKSDPVDPLLNKKVVVEPAGIGTMLDANLTNDVLPALLQMTGQAFTVTSSSSLVGVVRVRVVGGLAKQQYRIQGGTYSDVLIEGGGWRGCRHGLYAWLSELGIEALAPGARWMVVPARADLRMSLSLSRTPAFDTIAWQPQGSGVTDPFPDTQAQRTAWYDWLVWNRRPLKDYTTASIPAYKEPTGPHYDATCYTNKQADFDAHDEHFAQLDPTWKPSRTYYFGQRVTNGTHRYTLAGSVSGPPTYHGISAASGGPTGVGAGIVDGSCVWDYYTGPPGGAPTRQLNYPNFHHTHGGAGGTDDPNDYTGSDPASVVAIYSAERLGITTGLRYEMAHAGDDPENADLELNLSTAVNDGNQNCQDDKCNGLLRHFGWSSKDASATDTSFWRSGMIAAVLKAAEPNAVFRIHNIAYNLESGPPTNGHVLSPDQLIMLAQNLFNMDAYPSTILLDRWVTFRDLYHFRMGIYDYWSLPAHELNGLRYPAYRAWRYFRQWVAKTQSLFNGETTTGVGAIGLHWWGALRMNWDGTSRTDASLVDQWCTTGFGAAAVHVKRMLTRWWGQEWPVTLAHGYELGLSFDDLHQADVAVAGDAAIRPRVAALMTFVTWLHYRTTWYALTQDDPLGNPTPAECDAVAGPLLVHTWSSRDTYMIDSAWVHAAIASDAHLSAGFRADWTIPTDPANYAAWRAARGIASFTDAQIRTAFDNARALYTPPTPATYTTPDESSLVAPLVPVTTTAETSVLCNGGEGPPTGHVYLFAKKLGSTRVLTLEAAASILPGSVVISLYNAETGALVSTEEVEFTIPWYSQESFDSAKIVRTFDLANLAVGFYKIVVENNRGQCWHQLTQYYDVPIVRVGTYDRPAWAGNTARPPLGSSGFYPQYFFVPKGVTAFHVYIPVWTPAGQAEFIVRDGDDNVVVPVQIFDRPRIYRVDVAAGQRKKFWRIEGPYENNGALRLLDLPTWFAPSREQVILPANLWNE